jgi:hypothetical protein
MAYVQYICVKFNEMIIQHFGIGFMARSALTVVQSGYQCSQALGQSQS